MGSFHRVDTSKLVKGAARFMHAPITQAKPAKLDDVIQMAVTPADANEQQTVTITGGPTGGTFTLSFDGNVTANIAWNATAAAVRLALEALPNVEIGDVTAAGGPLPATLVTLTFAGQYANRDVPLIVAAHALTGGATPTVVIAGTVAGSGQYSAKLGWREFGGTREGIQISVNNTEDSYEIDQIPGEVGSAPNAWECSVSTRLAEMTLETFVLAWEGATITEDTTPPTGSERETGFAGATSYTEKRLAVMFQRPNGKVQGFFFHKAVRSPQEGVLDFRKSGDPQSVQVRFKVLADPTEVDPKKQFFRVREQV